jgi:trehalose-phosphatase
MPRFLLNQNGQVNSDLIKLLGIRNRIILFLDYDGTVTPIKKRPYLAVLSPNTKELLMNLRKCEDLSLFIITGRENNDIKEIIGIKDINIISNHGLQFNYHNKLWVHPETKHYTSTIKKVSSLINDILPRFPNTFIEDKKLSFTVHFRNTDKNSVPELKKTIVDVMQPYQEKLKILKGKKIIEIRPNIEWDKGRAVLKMLNILKLKEKKYICVYIGDDRTDENAFKVLNKNEITIHVGTNKRTQAKYYLRSTKEVYKFLEEIYLMQSERGGYV